jgi:hypothetical protein
VKTLLALTLLAGCIVLPFGASAGPVFDDLLNYPVVDQRCPADATNEGLALAGHGKATWHNLTKEAPIGQTVTLGPKAAKLWRVCVGLCWYPDNWVKGEEVTFTLYDSPAKRRKLYSRTIDFDHKWHKWDVPFDCHTPAKPGRSFYFELTHNGGGDNGIHVITIPGDEYKRGTAYIAGKPQKNLDLYFVQISKPKEDRLANLRKFLGRIDLDDPIYVSAKTAANSGKLDQACKLVLRAFEKRHRDHAIVPKPIEKGKLNTLKQDLLCSEGRYYHHPEKRDEWIPMTDQTTWRETWPNTASYVRQNDLFRELGEAYRATGDEKYARKLNDLMLDYIQDNASPYEGGMRGGRWVAMFVGWRLGDAWDGYGHAIRSKGLTDDVRLGWIDYQARMARFVELEPSGANQENASAETLMNFAYRFPDFRDSKKWQQQGFDRLMANSLDLYRPDGGSKEPTMNYQGYALGFLISGLEAAKKHNLNVPAEVMPRLEKIHEFIAYILAPDGQAPSNGDTNCLEFRANVRPYDGWRPNQVMRGAEWFKREDLRFIATAGKSGKRPEITSHLFPDTRYAVMRSDWGGPGGKDFDQARYLLFRAGYDGGHSHSDYNQITLYAYGKHLIIDPGRSDYGTPLQSELEKAPSHNVLLVDDLPMNDPDPTLHSWHTTAVMDFIDNSYNGLYSGVDHRRAVIFVKPDYYVMFDEATSDKPRNMGINFWLTPPEPSVDEAAHRVHTNEPDGANVLLQIVNAVGCDGPKIDLRRGRLDHDKRIWDNIPVVTFRQENTSSASFVTLIYPYPKGASVSDVGGSCTPGSGTCLIKTPTGSDAVMYVSKGSGATPSPYGTLEGRAGVIRYDRSDAVTAFALLEGTRIGNRKGPLAFAESTVHELSVRYTADTIEVTCPRPEPSLEIATLGRAKAVVNGIEKAMGGEMFRAFE